MTAERRCFRTPRTCFGGVAAHDTLKSGLSVSAAGRPASVVPRRPGRGPPTEPTARPARSGQPKPPGAGELAALRPRPARGARAAAASPNSYFCLLFVSLWGPAAGGTRAGVPGPGRDSAPRRGLAGRRRRAGPRARQSGAAWTRVPQRRPGGACVLAARRSLAFPSESFGAGTSPRCAGRRAAEAAGPRGPGSAGPSWAPGRTRLPPPPPATAAARLGQLRAQDGGNFSPPTRLTLLGAWVSLAPRPSFPCPPFPSLSCLHHP